MSPEDIRELWSRFLTGEDLSAAEQQGLVDALEADPQLRESLLENLQLDGVLRELGATRRNGEAFVRTLTDCIGAEHDATRFIRKVELRLGEPEPPPPAAAGTGRRTKPSTTRILRRRSSPSVQGESAWKPALIAAGAFVAILLLVTDFKTGTRRPVTASKERALPAAPAPVTTSPERTANPSEDLRRWEKLERNQRENTRLRTAPPAPDEKPEDRRRQLEANEAERRIIEDEFRRPAAPSRSGNTETLPPSAPAVLASATLEQVQGAVYVVRSRTNLWLAKKGEKVRAGHDVETKGGAIAVLRYDDGTRVELGPQSAIREVTASAGLRRLSLTAGSLQSEIAPQAADRPLTFITPHAEAAILGTTIRLTVDPKGATTLDVKEGKVRFTRLQDAKSVEVTAGQFAIAAPGTEIAAQKSFPDEVLVKFGPYDLPLKPGQVLDLGEEFTSARGYGWKGPMVGPVIGSWRDPSGVVQPRNAGRMMARRTALPEVDPLKASDVVAGWIGHAETWIMPVPNGLYQVSVSCGDYTFQQGPHHVWIEGSQLINQKMNKAKEFVEGSAVVEVKDGELTMKVGGNPGPRKSGDGSMDTLINYLIIKRLKK